ncbi:hypothetical protein [Snuella sedimenti]|uniref:Uncharacterized protein n=1 Tax=Snuella sedimenti TaxID=2798802 RepID=A0A8J7IGJ8_9FLAO|nr:hypothetical protein [Snuella sedimenti]MBJ6367683.1 hypothetical protein [Snuella sedimenti]
MRILRTLIVLFLFSSLIISCTKQDISDNDTLITDTENVVSTEGTKNPPPPTDD